MTTPAGFARGFARRVIVFQRVSKRALNLFSSMESLLATRVGTNVRYGLYREVVHDMDWR